MIRYGKILLLTALPVLLWSFFAGSFLPSLASREPALFFAIDALGWVILPMACLGFAYKAYHLTPDRYGLRWGRTFDSARSGLIAVALAAAVFLTFLPVQAVAWWLFPPSVGTLSYAPLIPKGALGGLVALYLALTAAVVEEIFFRGLLKELFLSFSGSFAAKALFVGISALLFGVSHWALGAFKVVAALYLGVAAALLYLRFDSLWPNILGHLFLNLFDR